MIVGIGSDLCAIERIAGAIERQGQRFLDRVFSEGEQRQAAMHGRPDVVYARVFAAKEACLKALGTGITERVRWTDVEIIGAAAGLPEVRLSEGAHRRMRRLVGAGNSERLVLSISSNGEWASALVVLERVVHDREHGGTGRDNRSVRHHARAAWGPPGRHSRGQPAAGSAADVLPAACGMANRNAEE